jgi:hypothetical protein
MKKSANGFPLRANADGTFDSICPRCFQTAVRHSGQGEIEKEEKLHLCREPDLIFASEANKARHEQVSKSSIIRTGIF